MNRYVITIDELQERGLNLSDLVVDDTCIPAIIGNAYEELLSRIFFLNDDMKGKSQLYDYLGHDDEKRTSEDKIDAFITLQYKYIWNVVYIGNKNPIDESIDAIIVFRLGLGKINGFQKGLFYKNN